MDGEVPASKQLQVAERNMVMHIHFDSGINPKSKLRGVFFELVVARWGGWLTFKIGHTKSRVNIHKTWQL